jgi:hypothetical protein
MVVVKENLLKLGLILFGVSNAEDKCQTLFVFVFPNSQEDMPSPETLNPKPIL